MITSKKELRFYIMADSMMNRGYFKRSLMQRLKECFLPDPIMDYLRTMRKLSYYSYKNTPPHLWYYLSKYQRLGRKLGFSIGHSVFGYGLVIPHWGTIVVGAPNTIGNYAVLHTSVCITANNKTIGNALYVSTGAKMTSKIVLGDNVTIAANSVVNRSNENGNVLLVGAPAQVKRNDIAWYYREESDYKKRVEQIEKLRINLSL